MKPPALKSQGHSAQVHMELRLNGHIFPIAQMAPGFLVLKQPIDHAPAEGEVYLRIDESERCWRVRLVEGIRVECRKTKVAPLSIPLDSLPPA